MSNERPPAEKVISAKGAKNKLRKDKSGQRKIKAAESAGTQAPPTHTTLQVSKDPKARTFFISFWQQDEDATHKLYNTGRHV